MQNKGLSFQDSLAENLNGPLEGVRAGELLSQHILGDQFAPAMLVLDPHDDYRVLLANASAARLLGAGGDELSGIPLADYIQCLSLLDLCRLWQAVRASDTCSTEILCDLPSAKTVAITASWRLLEHGGQALMIVYPRDVSDHVQAVRETEASRKRLEETQRIGKIGSWSLDLAGNILSCSNEIHRIFQVDADGLGNSYAAFRCRVHPDDVQRVDLLFAEAVEHYQSYEIEYRLKMPCGWVKHVRERGETVGVKDGSPILVNGTLQDITDAKVLGLAFRMREEEVRSLLEMSPDIVVRYDRDCRRIYVNRAYDRLSGKPRQETLGKTIRECWPTPSGAAMQQCCENEVRAVLEAGLEREWELSWTSANGRPVCFALRGVPEFGHDGAVLSVLTFARDISERVLAERKLAQREQEFRTLVENSPDIIVRYDRHCRRIFTNPAYDREFGAAAPMARNNTPAEFWRPTNISAEQYMAILRKVMDSGEADTVLLAWREDDGQQIREMFNLVAERGADGEIGGVLAIGRNISAMWRQEILELMRLRIFERLAQGGGLAEILGLVVEFVKAEDSAYLCCIMLLDEMTDTLRIETAPDLPENYRLSIDGMAAAAVRSDQPLLIENLREHAERQPGREEAVAAGLVSYWSFPIVDSAKAVLGCFAIYRREPGMPSPYDLDVIREARHLAAIAVERKRIEEHLHRQARYDGLTGLPNRQLFNDRLREEIARAGRGHYSLSLLFIDLDRFKEVNDTLGHAVGDALLQEVARRIRGCVRESDTVARLAGDEFVVILPEMGDQHPLERVARSIVGVLGQPFFLGEHSAYVSASVGIALYPQDADNGEALVGCADQAMYAAKERGRNGYSFFTRGTRELLQQRMQLVNDLREALGLHQLEIHYQPIIDIASGRPMKAEALLRWHHHKLGMVPPDQFIPIAEETGLIQDIGAWVFCQAAETAMRWNALSDDGELRQISVNVSPRQFLRGKPDEDCIGLMREIGLNPAAMVIEITEGLLLEDQADVIAKLRGFQDAGMQLALDDFGTGYSAMAYLKKFNIDYLKIDRSFIRDLETDPGDRAIAEAIVVMAHRLGLKVIAEGVETAGQRNLLSAVGCEYVQGYLYAKPMPEQGFLAFVRDGMIHGCHES